MAKTSDYVIEVVYYDTHKLATEMSLSASSIRRWLEFFEIRHTRQFRNRKIPIQGVLLMKEIKNLVEVELYSLEGAKRQLNIKYGPNYERYYNPPKDSAVLGGICPGHGEEPPKQDIMAPNNENQV